MGQGEGLSAEGLAGAAEPIRSPLSDSFRMPGGAIPSPAGSDQLARAAEMLSHLAERFGQTNQQLQETLAVLHQRFPDKVREPEMPRTGPMRPGSDPAKEAPAANDPARLAESMDKLTETMDELRRQFSGHGAGPAAGTANVPLSIPQPRELVPVLRGGSTSTIGGAHGGATFSPHGGATGGAPGSGPGPGGMGVAPGGLGIPRPGLSIGAAPPPPAKPPVAPVDPAALRAGRQMFLNTALAKQAKRSKVSAADASELARLLGGTGSGLLGDVKGQVGKGIFTEGILRRMREQFGIEFPTPTDLPGNIVRGLLAKHQGGHQIDEDLFFQMAVGGMRDNLNLPQDTMAALYSRRALGKDLPRPSRKMVRSFAEGLGLSNLLPREWVKPTPGVPEGSPGFVGPTIPPAAPSPGDPQAPGFVGPPVPPAPPPKIANILTEARERAEKRQTISEKFLGSVRTALSGRTDAAEFLKKLEGKKGSTLTKSLADELGKLLGGSGSGGPTPGPSFAGGGREPMGLLGLMFQGLGGNLALPFRGMMPGGFGGLDLGRLGRSLPALTSGKAIGQSLLGVLGGALGDASGAPAGAAGEGAAIAKRFLTAGGANALQRMPAGFGPGRLGTPPIPMNLRAPTAGAAGSIATAAGGAAVSLSAVAAAAAAVGYAFTKLPHDIAAGARGQLDSVRGLSGLHGGITAALVDFDMRAMRRDIKYGDKIVGTTRGLAAATADLDDRLLESRSAWTNVKNVTWSGLAGAGSAIADDTRFLAEAGNRIFGNRGAADFANRAAYNATTFLSQPWMLDPGGSWNRFWNSKPPDLQSVPETAAFTRFILDVGTEKPLRPPREVKK